MTTSLPAPTSPPETVRLLVIEDNPGDVDLIRVALAAEEPPAFRIEHAGQLREGCGLLLKVPYDLVLLDLSLPDSQGVEGVRWIKELAENLPVVVLTGHADDQLALAATQMGAEDYVVKGQADPRALRRTILQVLERHRLRTELELAVRRADHLATHDTLTSLANRQRFQDVLEMTIARAERYGHAIAVMMMDLDGFKQVNDRLGHSAGDHLLWTVARRLAHCVRESDTVARLGGDEFTVLLPEPRSSWDASRTAEKILEELSRPVDLEGAEVRPRASIGIALYPGDGRTASALMRAADMAMYDAKRRKSGSYGFFRAESLKRGAERHKLERELRESLERSRFLVHYQPQIDVERNALCGAEALLRWMRLDDSLVGPADFLPVVEEIGLDDRLGNWVLGAVCRQIREWEAQGLPPLRIAVNLFASQYRSTTFAEQLARILDETGVAPARLELEIAEVDLGKDERMAGELLAKLKKTGVGVAIDDIGRGHASIRSIGSLPVDELKIGRELISRLQYQEEQSIATAAVSVAHGIGCEVMAVGIETPEQMDILRTRRCSRLQGRLFARPMGAKRFGALLQNGMHWSPSP